MKRAIVYLCFGWMMSACGGNKPAPQTAATEPETDRAEVAPVSACARPIETPGEVWKRVEQARALSPEALLTQCGLGFIAALSRWRSPPVDLLRPIILSEGANREALERWVAEQARVGNRAAAHAAAMDILGNWQLGDDTAQFIERAAAWKSIGQQMGAVDTAVSEASEIAELFSTFKALHELRCALEVNPLGFAVSCTPIHPAREKIDLHWQEERREGLFLNVALTKCKGSPSCKKLKPAAAEFAAEYQAAKARAEALQTDVFKEQALQWLRLPAFSKGAE